MSTKLIRTIPAVMAGLLLVFLGPGVISAAPLQLPGTPSQSPAAPSSTTWARAYGGSFQTAPLSVAPTNDGGFLLVGWATPVGAFQDKAWLVKLDGSGQVIWQRAYGDELGDLFSVILPASDGGFVVLGENHPSAYNGGSELWLLHLDDAGNILWQKTFGTPSNDHPTTLIQTRDGGYFIAANTEVFLPPINNAALLLKVDASGNLLWQKAYEYGKTNSIAAIVPASDGGYIVAAGTFSETEDGNVGWLFKIDESGAILWQKTYSGAVENHVASIAPTSDGGYIVVGNILTPNIDAWMMKVDSSGDVVWSKSLGGAEDDFARSIRAIGDGNFLVVGDTSSFGGGSGDVWLFKLDESGQVLWQQTYGGTETEVGFGITPSGDGGILLHGITFSIGPTQATWLLKLDSAGKIGGGCALGVASTAVPLDLTTNVIQGSGVTAAANIAPVAFTPAQSDTTVQTITQCESSEALNIKIDIKPGDPTNAVNLNSKALLPVAILSTATFDALAVDPMSARFGPSSAIEGPRPWQVKDVNHDGRLDLLLYFSIRDSGIQRGQQSACLVAQTRDGVSIRGCDSIRVLPKKS